MEQCQLSFAEGGTNTERDHTNKNKYLKRKEQNYFRIKLKAGHLHALQN